MNGLRRLALLALIALCATAPTAQADIPAPPSEWYGLPGLNAASGAQWPRVFAYSTPPNVVYAGLEGGGVFKSSTGGASWSAFNAGFPNPLITNVRALLTSSTGTDVWAGTDTGVWKSSGGGAWQPIAQGEPTAPAKRLTGSVQSLISLPGNIMLAGVASGGVYKSTDGGETWTPPAPNNGMPMSETPYGFVGQPPQAPAFVLSASSNGVFRSTDQGSTWTLASDGIPSVASPIQPWVDTTNPSLVFVSTGSNGVYRSVNGGITYAPINDGLGAVRARGFQIFPVAPNPNPPAGQQQGAHLYAATEEGLWQAFNTHAIAPPPPRWHEVTQEGLHETDPVAHNVIMWALTAPAIPGAGTLGLIAGTQSNGGYFLAFEPVDSPCPTNNTNPANTDCPRLVDTSPEVGKTLTIQSGLFATRRGVWTGTGIIEYAYQWQRCTGTTPDTCSDIPDAEEVSYTVPGSGQGVYFRIEVTATNPAPSFGLVQRYSTITGVTAASPDTRPGFNQSCPPPIVVLAPGETTSPQVGDTMYAAKGSPCDNVDTVYGWFNPVSASEPTYRWLRCDGSGADCNEILGATSRSYTLQRADGTRNLRVRVTGSASGYSTQRTSSASYDVTSLPAEIGDPIPDPDGGPAKSQAPALAGDAYVGETLAGTVGGWKDPTTDFLRRWVRCEADGTACTYIQQVASTDPETGSTYVVREGDLGYTIRLRVEADVNNDLTGEPPTGGDGIDNHLPHSVEVDTAPSAVVTYRPLPPPPAGGPAPGPGPGPGGGAADRTAPTLSALKLTKKSFVAGKGTSFRFRLSEAGSVRIVISKPTTGRRVGKACKPTTRKNRRRKKCTYQKRITTLTRSSAAGNVSIPFSGKIGKRKLRRGTYLATITVRDGAGNVSKPVRVSFRIVRR